MLYKYKSLVAIIFCILATAVVYAQPVIDTKPNAAGMLDELNKWRTAIGLRPLTEDKALSMAAQFHVDDMVKRNYFAHIAPSPVACGDVMVTEPPQRVACFDRAGRGEDLAGGFATPEEAVRGLIAHYPHCVDILKPIYTSVGGGENNKTYAFEFDGQVDPDTTVDINTFCGCTSDNSSEDHIQSCVNKLNNGSTPAVLPALPLQVKMRLPADKNKTYDKNSSGGQTIGAFGAGTVTVKIIPVSGNPSGIPLELGDGKFNKIPDAKGTDQLVYTLTKVTDLSVSFTSFSLAQNDKFTVEVSWLPADTGSNAPVESPTAAPVDATTAPDTSTMCSSPDAPEAMTLTITNNTDQPLSMIWVDPQCNEIEYNTITPGTSIQQGTYVGHVWVLRHPDGTVPEQFAASADRPEIIVGAAATAEAAQNTSETASTSVCSVSVASVDELVNAINQANDETACPGPDTLFLTSDLQVAASYEGGENAFPVITSSITISSMNREIARDANAPAFRFFYVDATKGNKGNLSLEDIKLRGGEALDAGAVFVDARGGGQSSFKARNVSFVDNKSNGNGGALLTLSMNGGQVDATIVDSFFDNNSGVYGGAFYSGGFDDGNAIAWIINTNFTNNKASAEGGAVYNNGLGNSSSAKMSLQDVAFTNTESPQRDVIHNNGRSGGYAELSIANNQFRGSGVTFGQNDIIFNRGTEGSASMTWKSQQVGGSENVCVGNGSETLEVVACPT